MARDPLSRPVSGEILTGQSTRSEPVVCEQDIIDAEYETVIGRHERLNKSVAATASSDSSIFGLTTLKGRDASAGGSKAGPAFWLIGTLIVGVSFWVSGGHALVINNASVVQPKMSNPLMIDSVKSRIESRDAKEYLLVDGVLANSGGENLRLPDLVIQVKSADGSVIRYRIAGGEQRIKAGGRYAFSSRLNAPDAGVENVKVIIRDRDTN